jgi:predicted phosphoribosyltransferase
MLEAKFRNRRDAGRLLARKLRHFANRSDVVVLALPRGGVPVGFEVARGLHAQLDVFVECLPTVVDGVVRREMEELHRREQLYRTNRSPVSLRDKTAILVDDGLATGSTMHAAVQALRQRAPGRIVIAVPISSPDTCAALGREVDEIVCAVTPEPLYAVGIWFADFTQTSDEEVEQLLRLADELHRSGASQPSSMAASGA